MSNEPKPTIEGIRPKLYKCSQCGHEQMQSTNHYGECYSLGSLNACPACPPYKRPTTWICTEQPPAHMGVPEPWTKATITIKAKRRTKK